MLKSHTIPAALALLAVSAAPAAAAPDIVVGLGAAEFPREASEDAAIFTGEVHGRPFAEWRGIGFSAAGAAVWHSNGTYWIGAGISALAPLKNGWFVEASFMPGFYDPFDAGDDLGADLEFRSLLGVGRQIGERTSLSLALSHKSNADTGRINPGVDALSLRLRQSFD